MDIAIDFDGTFAADPKAFTDVVQLLQNAGHTVVLITNRTRAMGAEVLRLVDELMPIIFAGDMAMSKHEAAKYRGYNIQIWIDDSPGSIHSYYQPGTGLWSVSKV